MQTRLRLLAHRRREFLRLAPIRVSLKLPHPILLRGGGPWEKFLPPARLPAPALWRPRSPAHSYSAKLRAHRAPRWNVHPPEAFLRTPRSTRSFAPREFRLQPML